MAKLGPHLVHDPLQGYLILPGSTLTSSLLLEAESYDITAVHAGKREFSRDQSRNCTYNRISSGTVSHKPLMKLAATPASGWIRISKRDKNRAYESIRWVLNLVNKH